MGGTANGQKLDQTDLFGAGSTVDQTLSADLTLTDADQSGQFVNCNGANRICTLPAEATSNHYFAIVNTTAATYTLTVKDDAANVLITLTPGNGAFLLSDGTSWKVINPGGITYSENVLSGNVTMTNADQYYDGPSLSLAAGTWLLIGQVTFYDSGGSSIFTAKLWDGSTVEVSGTAYESGAFEMTVGLSGVVVLSGTTTMKISVADTTTGGTILAACGSNGAGNNASRLTALKIA